MFKDLAELNAKEFAKKFGETDFSKLNLNQKVLLIRHGVAGQFKKTRTANISNKTSYQYMEFSEIVNNLSIWFTKAGLTMVQNLCSLENGITGEIVPALETLIIDVSNGETLSSGKVGLPQIEVNASGAKGLGAVITYFKRYQLAALLGIVCDDDTDGIGESETNNNSSYQKPETVQQHSKPSGNLFCEVCSKIVNEKTASYSKNKYGKILCYECQRK